MEKVPVADTKLRVVEPLQVAFIDDVGYETIITNNEKIILDEANHRAKLISLSEREKVFKSTVNIDNMPIDKINNHAISVQQRERALIKQNNANIYDDLSTTGSGKCSHIKYSAVMHADDDLLDIKLGDLLDIKLGGGGGGGSHAAVNNSETKNPEKMEKEKERELLGDYKSVYEESEYKCSDYKSEYETSSYQFPDRGGI